MELIATKHAFFGGLADDGGVAEDGVGGETDPERQLALRTAGFQFEHTVTRVEDDYFEA